MTATTGFVMFVCAVAAVVAVVVTVVAIRPERLVTAVARRSEVTRLPLGSPAIVDAITARLRRQYAATGATITAGMVVAATAAVAFADTVPDYLLTTLPFLFIAVGVTNTVVTVSRPLFSPAPGALRVARAGARRLGDYLGPLRRSLPWCITAAAAIWIAVLAVRGEATVLGLVTVALAVAGLLVFPSVDRAVLDAPQAASHSLELAWDDAFRADALGTARVTVCLVALTSALFVLRDLPSWSPLALNLALTTVTVIYARAPLRAALLPPWLAVGLAGRR